MPTLGVTLELPEPWFGQLQTARIAIGDPLGLTVPPHITVLGPTEVDTDRLDAIGEHLQAVADSTAPIEIELRGTGTFRPVSPVVFVQVARGISECEQLEERVKAKVPEYDSAFRYHPHVTVAQSVPEPELDSVYEQLADFHAAFVVPEMCLAVLAPDETWRPVRAYSFGA